LGRTEGEGPRIWSARPEDHLSSVLQANSASVVENQAAGGGGGRRKGKAMERQVSTVANKGRMGESPEEPWTANHVGDMWGDARGKISKGKQESSNLAEPARFWGVQ